MYILAKKKKKKKKKPTDDDDVEDKAIDGTNKRKRSNQSDEPPAKRAKGLFLLYLFRFRNTNRSENMRSFCVNRNRNSIPVLVYKPGQGWFTLVYVGLP